MAELLKTVGSRFHALVFGQDMGENMQQFLRNLTYSFAGLTLANGILFAATMAAGRMLGPVEFGRFALAVAVAQVLVIPMLLGMDIAGLRALAQAVSFSDRRRVVTSGWFVVMAASLIVGLVALFFARMPHSLGFSPDLVRLAVILALVIASRQFFDGAMRGLSRFRRQAHVRVAEALLVLAGLGWLIFSTGLTHRGFVAVVSAGAAAAVILYLVYGGVQRFLTLTAWDWQVARELWYYNRFGLLGALGGLLIVSGEKIVVARLLGEEAMGVYAAYYLLSVQIAAQLSYMFVNVFFPAVVQQRSVAVVWQKLDRLLKFFFAPAVLLGTGISALGLFALGRTYAFSWLLAVSMSAYAVLFFVWQVYWWLIASTGARGVRFTSLCGLAAGVAYLAGIYLLAERLALFAPVVSFVLVSGGLAAAVYRWRVQHTPPAVDRVI